MQKRGLRKCTAELPVNINSLCHDIRIYSCILTGTPTEVLNTFLAREGIGRQLLRMPFSQKKMHNNSFFTRNCEIRISDIFVIAQRRVFA